MPIVNVTNTEVPVFAPQLNVVVGSTALVEPQGVGERFKTTFVGWDTGRFIILRLPSRLELREHLYTGKLVIVRYLSCSGDVCGFQSAIHGINYKPQHLLFLDYPAKLETFHLRKESRVDCFLPATLTLQDGSTQQASIVNISKGGCRIGLGSALGEHGFTVGQEIVCEFVMLGQDYAAKRFVALVRSISDENAKTFIGVEFKEVDAALRDDIEKYVQSVSDYLAVGCPEKHG